jgi:hypothetical protein
MMKSETSGAEAGVMRLLTADINVCSTPGVLTTKRFHRFTRIEPDTFTRSTGIMLKYTCM